MDPFKIPEGPLRNLIEGLSDEDCLVLQKWALVEPLRRRLYQHRNGEHANSPSWAIPCILTFILTFSLACILAFSFC